jgi:integrase
MNPKAAARGSEKNSLFQRKSSPFWWIRRIVGHPAVGEIRISTRTTSHAIALSYDLMIVEYRNTGRFEPLIALKGGLVTLHDLHTHRDPARLNALLAERSSPLVKPLLDEWLADGVSTTNLRPSSMRRYKASWKHAEAAGLLTSDLRLRQIDQGFVAAFKKFRRLPPGNRQSHVSKATLNRDLAAIGSFLTWCAEEKGLSVVRPKLAYLEEPAGRDRWLTREELAAFQTHCDKKWWPLFHLLFTTGMTISEALGLRTEDLDFTSKRVSLHEEGGRLLKRKSRQREIALTDSVIELLQAELQSRESDKDTRVFPVTYSPARKAWIRTCKAAAIKGATIHDSRHTFAVHAVQQGVPEARLQKLLGHSHFGTTRRYATHAPEQFVAADVDRVSKSMGFLEASVLTAF